MKLELKNKRKKELPLSREVEMLTMLHEGGHHADNHHHDADDEDHHHVDKQVTLEVFLGSSSLESPAERLVWSV